MNKQEQEDQERVTELLQEVDGRLDKAANALDKAKGELALEVGRNIKWQTMFEELGQAAVSISSFVKRTYLTKTINIQELEAVYILADRIEAVMLAYQKRKDLINYGKLGENEVVDDK